MRNTNSSSLFSGVRWDSAVCKEIVFMKRALLTDLMKMNGGKV